ncbi:copper resistance protein CopC [soil metagenome]
MRTGLRFLVAAILMMGLSLAGSAIASAHAVLVASDPAAEVSLPVNPARVNATFNEQMQPAFAAMTVIGPDGGQYSDGNVEVQGAVISVGVRPGGPAGDYTVNYRATSADGHVVSGAWTYTVTESPPLPTDSASSTPVPTSAAAPTTTASAAAAQPASADGGIPAWPFVVGAAVIVAGGAIWAARRRL